MSQRRKTRDIAERFVVEGELTLESPCLLSGGEPNEVSDRPLLRDEDLAVYIPGTTLAGLVRHYLTSKDTPADEICELLGPDTQSDGPQSRLLFSDAPCVFEAGVELRDGVAICPKTGIAVEGKKYDLELLATGSKFKIKMELLAPNVPSKLKHLLGSILCAFEEEEIRIGGRTRRGYGRCRVDSWNVWSYTLTTPDGLFYWLTQSAKPKVLESGRQWLTDPRELASESFSITLNLKLTASILIGSSGQGPNDADRAHLTRIDKGGRKSVVAGTSLAGILRSQCRRIANTIGAEEKLVSELFGSSQSASRVRVEESTIEQGTNLRHTRVKINPWTGGAAEGALFDQDCHYGGTTQLLITSSGVSDPAKALLLLACRDLALGQLSIGGQTGVGRGQFEPAGPQFASISGPNCKLVQSPEGVCVEPSGALDKLYEALEASCVR
jgi:CRISPR/Cas system CSM-associated protein Csm3 (group 7 of RAMP superfamily)